MKFAKFCTDFNPSFGKFGYLFDPFGYKRHINISLEFASIAFSVGICFCKRFTQDEIKYFNLIIFCDVKLKTPSNN